MAHTDSPANELIELLRRRLDDLPPGGYVAAVEADKFHAWLQEHDPQLLAEWLRERAPDFLRREIVALGHHARVTARARAGARAFADAVDGYRTGDTTQLSVFDAPYVVNGEHLRKPVREMTGGDHLFVADRYVVTGNRALLLAEFHRQVARRVGDRTTEEVFTADEYEELLLRFSRPTDDGANRPSAALTD